MNSNWKFTYWAMKVVGLLVLAAPLVFKTLPMGWENLTMGVVAHGVLDYLNQWYHSQTA